MPILKAIEAPCGTQFWDTVDVGDMRQLMGTVKQEFVLPNNPATEMHYIGSQCGSTGVSLHCFRNCWILLLRGELIVKNEHRTKLRAINTGYAYHVVDEVWIWLGGLRSDAVVIEMGDQVGSCSRATKEGQAVMHALQHGSWWERRLAKKQQAKHFQQVMDASFD